MLLLIELPRAFDYSCSSFTSCLGNGRPPESDQDGALLDLVSITNNFPFSLYNYCSRWDWKLQHL